MFGNKTAIRSTLSAACLLTCSAQAAEYVLQAPSWGASQIAAVATAGGSVRFSHPEGLALASSDRADFLSAVLSGGAVTSGAADMVVEFTPPLRTVEFGPVEAAGPPVTDALFPYIQWAPQAVRAPQAWAAGYKGAGVRVAVIDGGIFGAHVDLAANVDAAAGRSFVLPNPLSSPATNACRVAWDCDTGTFWHGTHVSGIIAAPINNVGVVGIAPEATIVPVKALHSGSGSFGAIIQAIIYASTDGRANIINMSLGATFPRQGREAAELVSALNRAVTFATRQGTLVISSAGNDGLDMDQAKNLIKTPAESGNGLAISATGPLGFGMGATNFARISSYTTYGASLVTLAAPGGDFALPGNAPCTLGTATGGSVTRPCWVFDMVISTSRGSTPGGSYSWAAGTSMAAPAASAVAALIKQKFPNASVGDLKSLLRRATDDAGKVGHDEFYGSGFLNAEKAVTN